MSKKGKLSVRFQRLLPVIYPKIIIEGYTYKECSEWLEKEHDLKIAPNLFNTYINRYGNIKEETERYERYLQGQDDKWWPQQDESPQGNAGDYVFGSSLVSKAKEVEPNNKSTLLKNQRPTTSRQEVKVPEKISQSVALGLGPEPADNKFQDMPNPLDSLKRGGFKLPRNKSKKQD